jgi:hypothetical protein
MSLSISTKPSFDIFNLVTDDIEKLEIKENYSKDICFVKDKVDDKKYYSSFILDENQRTRIVCDVSFYPSSITHKYIPRLAFKKVGLDNNQKITEISKPINISFTKSEQSIIFWRFIGFLNSFKEIVDLGEFHDSYRIISKDAYFIEFESKDEKQKLEEIKELLKISELKDKDIGNLVFEHRKENIKAFYYLLKNKTITEKESILLYSEKYNLKGEEAVWHHFLKMHDWILGLNVDIKFIRDFYDEQKVGTENSKGSTSPKTDLLGISDYTTLIELKHSNTKIFKSTKSRANTWDFSTDFIEGVSQCLGQKFSLEKSFETKVFLNDKNERLDKNKHKTIDPKTVFIIGNRKKEFPHDSLDEHFIKSETFERFRRNNRNLEIVTYDELFERAYHMIYSKKIDINWFEKDDLNLK